MTLILKTDNAPLVRLRIFLYTLCYDTNMSKPGRAYNLGRPEESLADMGNPRDGYVSQGASGGDTERSLRERVWPVLVRGARALGRMAFQAAVALAPTHAEAYRLGERMAGPVPDDEVVDLAADPSANLGNRLPPDASGTGTAGPLPGANTAS